MLLFILISPLKAQFVFRIIDCFATNKGDIPGILMLGWRSEVTMAFRRGASRRNCLCSLFVLFFFCFFRLPLLYTSLLYIGDVMMACYEAMMTCYDAGMVL